MSKPGKKRSLGSFLRETALTRRYAASRYPHALDYDWATIPHGRAEIVNLLLSADRGGRYLEIGCAANELFDAVAAKHKIGVDPARGGTHRLTSDQFFAANAELFDVVFIDGLHVYPQVRRDLVNALAAVRAGGWVALHDMLPRDWIEEHVPQISTRAWTGDGWKVAFELLGGRDLDFRIIAADHGIAVIKVLGEEPRLPDLSGELDSLRFRDFHRRFPELPVVDFPAGRAWIESHLA
ncbi:MAG: class I SAM-dependent methyltransferase [Caulobacteraceae bacterium]|nr:class I SAM-dependent methyltransferase [Caulobacteraceae bacterium]